MIRVIETKNRLVLIKDDNQLVVNQSDAVLVPTTIDKQLIVTQPKVVLTAVAKQGPQGPPGTGSSGLDSHYTHNQLVASSTWNVTHNLGKFPSVTIVDSGNNLVLGDIQFTNANALTITFTSAFGGKAFIN